jgi:adenine-specific DNA-methyltransferase
MEPVSVVEPSDSAELVESNRERIEANRTRFESAVRALGKPFAKGDRFAIYNGDCCELIQGLPTESIDLTFTSPPYNIGKEYEKVIPLEEYVEWCRRWISQLERPTHREGAFMLNVGYVGKPGRAKALPLPYLLWDKTPFFMQQEIVWNYGAGVASRFTLSPRNEKLLWYVKDPDNYTFNLDDIRDPDVAYPNQKKNGKLRCNTIGKNPSDVWQIAKVTSGQGRSSKERTAHPAQFPRDLCERVIKGFAPYQGVVLDPFSGSGSAADTAIRADRFCIGFELRKDYCEIAHERLKQAVSETASLL